MRKPIRPFVVETKSRHKSLEQEMTSLIRRAGASINPPAAARTIEAHSRRDVEGGERPAPRRVLPAIEQARQNLDAGIVCEAAWQSEASSRNLGPSNLSEAVLPLGGKPEPRRPESLLNPKPEQGRVTQESPRAHKRRPVVERAEGITVEPAPRQPAEAASPIASAPVRAPTRRGRALEITLPPSLKWAVRLPDAVQRRLARRRKR
jgi:hypothetical protein